MEIPFTTNLESPETAAHRIAREKYQKASGEAEPTCALCGNALVPRIRTFGDGKPVRLGYFDCKCDAYTTAYHEILAEETQKYNARIAEMRRRRIDSLICQSGLGERFRKRTFDNFVAETTWQKSALAAAREFCHTMIDGTDKGLGLILSGSVGTGKTHLAAAIAIRMAEDGCPVIFGTAATLLAKIRAGWRDEEEAGAIDEMCKVPLLIIDDLGKEYSRKNSEGWSWANEQFFQIINSRYENYKPLVISTNYSMKQLADAMGDAIVSRLVECCQGVRCDGDDYRMKRWQTTEGG